MNRCSINGMKNTPATGKTGSIRRWMAILVCVLLLLVPFSGAVSAQDAQPQPTQDPAQLVPEDPTAPQADDDESASTGQDAADATPEPATSNQDSNSNSSRVTRSAQRADAAAGPGVPAVLAHGLAYVDGDEVVWQVRDIEVPAADAAESSIMEESIHLQRDGSSIIRNDATGKRAKTDAGEAYFRAAGDGYTVSAEGGESLAWVFELVNPDDVAIDAFYESPEIDDLDEGVYDMMLTRYVLQSDESVDMPDHSGAGLVMVSSGEIEIDAGGERSALAESDGQTIQDEATITNMTGEPAVFYYAYLGDEVSDATAGEAQVQADEPATTTDEPAENAADDAKEPAVDAETVEEAAEAETGEGPITDDAGNFLTSINVTADTEIYLVITVDGLTVFDGTLPAGASSGPVVGTTFTVYTSSGVNTTFTNACGETFKMGYEEGEATYVLEATASSCAP
jgi:hypothetical protein